MNQEQNEQNADSNENLTNLPEETSNPAEAAVEVAEQSDSEIDNLPIESIGSYARIEELLTDEEKGETTNPTAQS